MNAIAHRLYRIHNGIASMLLIAALICMPKLVSLLMDYASHDQRYAYAIAREASGWMNFIVPGGAYGLFWVIWNIKRTDLRIKATQPPGFTACFEIRRGDQYFGIAQDRSCIVIVDMEVDFATCQPLGFVQTFIIQQVDSQSELSLRFNSFEYPSMRFRVKTRAASAIAAKINYALWP
ncbi:hypothetical protein [Rugamonas apoptosis]|uniref:Uncharacterized protein n=1 Tax=Rugamonas apoptosis TaxID=2758570 RepID=A0A7W2FF56_9BURK|nr:hypothetical protein [Rugamonas apoptosis]MBA5690546.1 hypothetical protein [Rugamonas apoptosis]